MATPPTLDTCWIRLQEVARPLTGSYSRFDAMFDCIEVNGEIIERQINAMASINSRLQGGGVAGVAEKCWSWQSRWRNMEKFSSYSRWPLIDGDDDNQNSSTPIMSTARQGLKPLFNSAKCLRQDRSTLSLPIRAFSSSVTRKDAAVEQQSSTSNNTPPPASSIPGLDANSVYTARAERKLLRTAHKTPVGSRRQRAATQSSSNIPFEQLPYQCFQEARKILSADRQEKIAQIETQRARIVRLKAQQVSPQNENQHKHRLSSMQQHLEELKILADINDPVVKKRFEDGLGKIGIRRNPVNFQN